MIPSQHGKKAGLPPGTLIHLGKKSEGIAKLSVIQYDRDHFEANMLQPLSTWSAEMVKDLTNCWVNIDALHEVEIIDQIGQHFGVDALVLEDLLNTQHRPKMENWEDYLFITFKVLGIHTNGTKIVSEQISLVLGQSWMLSFQEKEGDLFNPLRERLKLKQGQIRDKKVDYLFYRLIDVVVDNYFHVLAKVQNQVSILEKKILESPKEGQLKQVQQLKVKIRFLKSYISPLRDALNSLIKEQSRLIKKTNYKYFQDVAEHLDHLEEETRQIESQNNELIGLYHSSIGHKTNQVMQLLTIISTIFIPLTFLAGIYGMNFEFIPELKWKYGYAIFWGIILALFGLMMLYFRKRKWL